MKSKLLIWIYISILKQWYGYKDISTELIYAQAKHETGNFTSRIFKENKNAFGMRQPSIRENSVSGSALGHATFTSLFNSVRDYFQRQRYFKIGGQSDDQFMVNTIDSNYAEDKQYLQKWHNVKRDLRLSVFFKHSHLIVYLFVGGSIFFLIKHFYDSDETNGVSNKRFNKSVSSFKGLQSSY